MLSSSSGSVSYMLYSWHDKLSIVQLYNATQDFEERLQMCVQQEGLHLTDIIFRT
jgi:hypothetical protein